MSWATLIGYACADTAASGVVVVSNGGQLGLPGRDQLTAYMSYPAYSSKAGADLASRPAPSAPCYCKPGSLVSVTGVSRLSERLVTPGESRTFGGQLLVRGYELVRRLTTGPNASMM